MNGNNTSEQGFSNERDSPLRVITWIALQTGTELCGQSRADTTALVRAAVVQ